jgi:SynChlorMet cassette protein ScmC
MGINNKYSTPKLIDLSTKRFTLQIDNRLKWTIIGIDKAIPWLERLAEIIKMSPAKALLGNCIIVLKSRKLSTIVPLSLLPKNLAISLPKTGWSNHDQKHCQIWTHPKSKTVVFEINQETTSSINIIRMWTLLDIIYQQIIGKGGFPIHSALVKKRGKGVIIAAHGGTGKSTCCRRIPPP